MAKRVASTRSPTAPNISGDLDSKLAFHARTRIERFFQFVIGTSMLCDYLDRQDGGTTNPAEWLSAVATHQADVGDRSTGTMHVGFDKKRRNIGAETATAFEKMDAAHFCNLGIKHDQLDTILTRINSLAVDEKAVASDMLQFVKNCAMDTTQLPQRINIGPDRIVDKLHGDLGRELLERSRSGTTVQPVLSRGKIKDYMRRANEVMETYRDKCDKHGDPGLAACAGEYIDLYDDNRLFDESGKEIPHSEPSSHLFSSLYDNVAAECRARGLDPTQFAEFSSSP